MSRWGSTLRCSAAVAVMIAAIVISAAIRLEAASKLPQLDLTRPEGMLKSDPALLFYLTQRVVDADGRVPADFRADPRVEHPERRDLAAMFTVGQEFVIAWARKLTGSPRPLHAFALITMAWVASGAALGVFGLAAEVTRSALWSAVAVALWATSWTSYRTASFIFLREDLSLPLYALHLWLLARAARRRTTLSFVLAGASLVLALSTWHATTFIATVEVGCLFGWSLATGRNPLAVRRAWAGVVVVAVGALLVPVLRAKGFVFSLPMQMAAALWLASRIRAGSRARDAGVLAGALVGCAAAAPLLAWATTGSTGDYSHVLQLFWAKLRFLGQYPDDPSRLPFEARMMWHGPFASGSPATFFRQAPAALLLLPFALPVLWRGLRRPEGDDRAALVVLGALAWVVMALLVWRTRAVFALVGPVAAVLALQRAPRAPALALVVLLLGAQTVWLGQRLARFQSPWYQPRHQLALRGTLDWIDANLPPEGAIAADIVNSTAVLAHTGHPIVIQPKYETRASRERLERFVTALYEGPPEAFARTLRDEFGARWLLADADELRAFAILAGRRGLPRGSAAWALLSKETAPHDAVAGFRLLYRSPANLRDQRLYEIGWGERGDLNPRPPGPQPGALTN